MSATAFVGTNRSMGCKHYMIWIEGTEGTETRVLLCTNEATDTYAEDRGFNSFRGR